MAELKPVCPKCGSNDVYKPESMTGGMKCRTCRFIGIRRQFTPRAPAKADKAEVLKD